MTRRSRSRSGYTLAALALLSHVTVAAGQIPPNARYLRFQTEHFRVIFPEGMEPFARRAASRAEWAYEALAARFMEPPDGRVALVISDASDAPNASATPIPFNRVTLIATPQLASRTLSYYSHWLDVTLVHELAHIFHLDRAEGLWRLPRALFGRAPAFFPAFYQPRWVIEGVPTYYESRLTGAGRAYGSQYDMLLSAAALDDAFVPVDAADGWAPVWPAGQTPYAYGGYYFRALAETHGDTVLGDFIRHGAARLPYTLDWAATLHFGHSLSTGWRRWREDFVGGSDRPSAAAAGSIPTSGQPLSGFLWSVPALRFSPDGRFLAYDRITPLDDPATVVVDPESGAVILSQRRNSAGGITWAPGGERIFTTQLERRDRYRLYDELFALDLGSGEELRLTSGGRLLQPDMSPGGGELVAVEVGQGSNRLVLIDLAEGEVRPLNEYELDVNWGRPRWSPDGRWIAVERWRADDVVDVVVLDREGAPVLEITADEAVDTDPTWSPDGGYLLWTSDREGLADIYAVRFQPGVEGPDGTAGHHRGGRCPGSAGPGGKDPFPHDGGEGSTAIGDDHEGARRAAPGDPATDTPESAVWRVTQSAAGTMAPEVSPDGRSLVYVAQHAGGYRIERIGFEPETWTPAGPPVRRLRPRPVTLTDTMGSASPAGPYSPFPGLWPKGWLPIVTGGGSSTGTFVGATVFGADDLERHAYGVLMGWRTGVEDIEGAVLYRYRGFGDPVVELTAMQDWAFGALAVSDTSTVLVTERERQARVAASFVRPRVRSVWSLTPWFGVEWFSYEAEPAGTDILIPSVTDLEVGLVAGVSTARRYARSISTERGLQVRLDVSHERLADDPDRWSLTGEAELALFHAFPVFGFANHVIAGRVALGANEAHDRRADPFELGGIPRQPLDLGAGIRIGGGSDYPIRAFDEGESRGDRVVAGSLEYRLPLLLVGRGHGLWPILLDRLSLSLFTDAGSAWFDLSDAELRAAAGLELSSDWVIGYNLGVRLRAGIAGPISAGGGGARIYLSTGAAY